MTLVWPVRSRNAARSGMYPSSSATARTLFLVASAISGSFFNARETVVTANPVASAIVRNVGLAAGLLLRVVASDIVKAGKRLALGHTLFVTIQIARPNMEAANSPPQTGIYGNNDTN